MLGDICYNHMNKSNVLSKILGGAVKKKPLGFLVLLALMLAVSGSAASLPFSQLTEDDLDTNPAVSRFWNPVLETVVYCPNLEEPELVAEGCAYFAPLFIFEDGKPVLMLNAITAFQDFRFGLKAIEFTFADEELHWEIDSVDASSDGFFADEGFLRVDAEILKPLQYIADNVVNDIHISFWGTRPEPLHFSLTDNQKYSIKLFMELYIGEGWNAFNGKSMRLTRSQISARQLP